MRRILFLIIGLLLAVELSAQEEQPTANWPYMYPEFMEGELVLRTKTVKALFNIHLNQGALHYVENGIIKETSVLGATGLTIGEELYRNVGGRMMKVLAETEGGFVVQEAKANYSAIVRKDGAYGTTSLNSTTTRTFLYNENVINPYNGYLLTDVYADLLAMKNDSEKLPVNRNLFLVIGLEQIPANKNSVASLEGLDKKAFKAFLKSEKIDWKDPQDLIKVVDYVTSE